MYPLVDLDDVRWSLGQWLLDQPKLTATEVRKMIEAARELAALVELNLRLRSVCESGFRVNYFSPDARQQIRDILDAMDKVSDGTQKTMQRRNEALAESIPITQPEVRILSDHQAVGSRVAERA